MTTICNEYISLSMDEQARLTAFENLKTGKGNIISRPVPIFRAVLQNGENWEDVVYAQNVPMNISADAEQITVNASTLPTRMGNIPIELTLSIRLDGEKVRFGAVIDNHSETTLNDFFYPCVGALTTLGNGKPGLLYPNYYGEYHTDIIGELCGITKKNGGKTLTIPYPYTLSMQWMTLIDGDQCLYLAGHDSLFHASTLRAAAPAEGEDVTLEMDKMAFVAPGERWECPEYVMWLYQGSWQQGADEYREWAATWRHPVTPKKWMQEMNGYFLVINRQQYGDILWPYKTIPHLYDLALENGCDTVGLFGWFESGHDNLYPDLEVSESMGGEKLLKDGIQDVQQRGGHVTLYYQGHLMDLGSPFYKAIGYRLEGKTRWNTPYFEEYSKYSESDFLRKYSRKMFSTICPWCKEWHDLMAEKADWIRSFGADGILYDQIGGINPTPCFDTTHGHTKPSLSYTQGRLKLLPAIRKSVDKYDEYSFMTETINDAYSQHIDCIHGIGNHCGQKGERADYLKKNRPMVFNVPEMFRYTFPDNISTVRNGRPYIHPRLANYSLTYGFRFEMELRYLHDKEYIETNQHPEWKEYAQAVCALRKRYSDLLLKGTYSCDAVLTQKNPALHHGVFTAGEKRCLVFWNDLDQAISLDVGDYAISHWETPVSHGEGTPKEVDANSAIVLFI